MGKKVSLEQVNILNQEVDPNASLEELFTYLLEKDLGTVVFSTSIGQEDQVLTHFIATKKLPIEIFTLDTGRFFQETYDVLASTKNKYKVAIKAYAPNHQQLAELVTAKGPNSFYDSVENRKECCTIRKIEPLKRALKGKNVWITGLRKTQSQNRAELHLFSYDENFDIIKFNPLFNIFYNSILCIAEFVIGDFLKNGSNVLWFGALSPPFAWGTHVVWVQISLRHKQIP